MKRTLEQNEKNMVDVRSQLKVHSMDFGRVSSQ